MRKVALFLGNTILVAFLSIKSNAGELRITDILAWNKSHTIVICSADKRFVIVECAKDRRQRVLYDSIDRVNLVPHSRVDCFAFSTLDKSTRKFTYYLYSGTLEDIEWPGRNTIPWAPIAYFPDQEIVFGQRSGGNFVLLMLGDATDELPRWRSLENCSKFPVGVPIISDVSASSGGEFFAVALRVDSSTKLLQIVSVHPTIKELASTRVAAGPVVKLYWVAEDVLMMKSLADRKGTPVVFHRFDVDFDNDGTMQLADVMYPATDDPRSSILDAHLDDKWLVISTFEGNVYAKSTRAEGFLRAPLDATSMPSRFIFLVKDNDLLVQTGNRQLTWYHLNDAEISKIDELTVIPLD